MIAAWMLSAVLAGMLVTAGALAADRVLVALRRQTRFVWLGAMGITLAWPLIAYARARAAAGSASPAAPVKQSVQQLAAIVVRASERSLHVQVDTLLIAGWMLLSIMLLVRMLPALRTMRMRRNAWRAERIDGVEVRLSRDIGPAVVGLDPMEVVLPEWTLELEPPLRALVLAHEEEHRRARDPYLLLASALLVVLVPWNPALWFQARRLRLAIELDCDARVLRAHPRTERYSLLLVAIAQRRSAGMSLLAPALSELTSNLERRIKAMQAPLKRASRVRLAVLGGVAVAAVAVACAIDAPSAPTATPKPALASEASRGGLRAEAEVGDSTRGWAIVPDSVAFTGWVIDSRTNQRVAVTLKRAFNTVRDGEERMLDTVADSVGRANFIRPSVERQINGELRAEKLKQATERVPFVEREAVTPGPRPLLKVRAGDVLYEYQVEKPAKWIAGTGTPVYPPQLKAAGIEGRGEATFVVDADGRVEPGSVRILKSTNSLFADAMLAALPNMQFTPAEVGGRAVRQAARQSFEFTVK